MAETRDFLFEIGTEEMPSAPLMNAVKQFGPLVERGLSEAGLAHGEVRIISSPAPPCRYRDRRCHRNRRGP